MSKGIKGAPAKALSAAMMMIGCAGVLTGAPGRAVAGAGEGMNDTVLFFGPQVAIRSTGKSTLGFDSGFTTALSGDIDASGWVVTGNLGYAHTRYAGALTHSFYSSLLIGYQWQTPNIYFSLSAGVALNGDYDTASGTGVVGAVGGSLLYVFETKAVNAPYVQSFGSFSTIATDIYLHAKAGYKTTSVSYGAEYTFFDDSGSAPTHRIGVFVNGIRITDRLSMSVSAGYQYNRAPDELGGAYATIGFSTPLSLFK
ncbi:MAG TPA: cellulose biosynthesis protein BcsS [Thermopetrobacter sp.]|nr:cellulose biosynthesis protein BcsS [Thermopetrobacter sp.]